MVYNKKAAEEKAESGEDKQKRLKKIKKSA